MKTLRKILIAGVIIFALIFALAYGFLFLQGKAIAISQLENLTHKKVTIDYLGLGFPLNLEIKNLNIEGLIKADYVYISPSIPGFLTGSVVLNDLKLIRPEFTYEKTQSPIIESAADINTPFVLATAQSKAIPEKKQPPRLIIKHLNIKDGKLDFVDHTVGSDGIKITVKDINFDLTNLYIYPHSAVTNFTLEGRIPWQQGQEEGKIEAKGWMNLFKKDMEATVKITDIDGISLYPYYSQWVDLEKARIESARLNWISDIKSVNNNLTAACHLELTDMAFKPRPEGEEQDKAEKIAQVVLDIFRSLNKGKVVFNFTIRTKMINPRLSLNEIKHEFELRLAEGMRNNQITGEDILKIPVKVVGSTVKGATDLSKGLIDGTYGLAKAFKDTLG